MDLLARREHSQGELLQKLLRRFPARQAFIDDEIAVLRGEGLQSDARLAESFLRSRAGSGQGPLKIRSEMKRKGLSDAVIADAFGGCSVDWFERLDAVARRKFGDNPPASARERAKRGRFLQQRGFSYEEIGTLY